MSGQLAYTITIKCSVEYPALTPGLFDLLRKEAAGCGFSDVSDTMASVEIEVSGVGADAQNVERLKARLNDLWMGVTLAVKTRERGVSS